MKVRTAEYSREGHTVRLCHIDSNGDGKAGDGEKVYELAKTRNGYSLHAVLVTSFSTCDKLIMAAGATYEGEVAALNNFIGTVTTVEPVYLFSQLDTSNPVVLIKELLTVKIVRPELYNIFVTMLPAEQKVFANFASNFELVELSKGMDVSTRISGMSSLVDIMVDRVGLRGMLRASGRSKVNAIMQDKELDFSGSIPGWTLVSIGAGNDAEGSYRTTAIVIKSKQETTSGVQELPAIEKANMIDMTVFNQALAKYSNALILNGDDEIWGYVRKVRITPDGKDAAIYVEHADTSRKTYYFEQLNSVLDVYDLHICTD